MGKWHKLSEILTEQQIKEIHDLCESENWFYSYVESVLNVYSIITIKD